MYKVLDLFAGAGGMSLGFKRTGKYYVPLAVEYNSAAKTTFIRNNENVKIIEDILSISNYDLIKEEYGEFDVVIGGPPCQGFSNANRQKNSLISQNNNLFKKYIDVVENLKPKAFVLENVKMIASNTHVFFKTKKDINNIVFQSSRIIEKEIKLTNINLPFKFVNQNNKKFNNELDCEITEVLFSNIQSLYKYSLKPKVNEKRLEKSKLNFLKNYSIHKLNNNKITDFPKNNLDLIQGYSMGEILFQDFEKEYLKFIEVIKVVKGIKELEENDIIINRIIQSEEGISIFVDSIQVIDYMKEKFKNIYNIEDGILNALWYGAPQSRQRYIAVGLRLDQPHQDSMLPEKNITEHFSTVKNALKDLEILEPFFSVGNDPIKYLENNNDSFYILENLRDSSEIYNHIITKTSQVALNRFESLKQGQNFHDIKVELINDSYANPQRTQNSIYQRLNYNTYSGTVTNVRKAMWIHPVLNRAVSVREAARLQTFPDSYEFFGKKDEQYQQVGNAVPPFMAEAIARKLLTFL